MCRQIKITYKKWNINASGCHEKLLWFFQVLKLYAWEPSFEKQILATREKEVKVLGQQMYLNASVYFVWTCAPFIVSSLLVFSTC